MIETAQAFGIDIGGSGIKGAPVNLNDGTFADERLRIPTPQPATPEAVADTVREILDHFEVADGTPIGVAFPAPVKPGKPLHYMSNLDQSWVGVDITALLCERCGRTVHVLNDADAAGLAEAAYGAAKGIKGLVDEVKAEGNQTTDGQTTGIYSLNGIRHQSMTRGLNIVRNADGTVKKVYSK